MLNTIERDILVRQDHSSFDQISYVQGTNDIPIIFHIQDYELESGTAARVYVRRPDGTAEYDIATVNGNDITVDVKTSMFSVVGDNMLQVNLFKGEDKLATFAITVHVKKNYAYCTIKSENVTDIFDQTLAKMEEATGKANTAAQNIQEKAERGDFTSTIQIGEVTTGEPGSEASANNSGTGKDAVIDLKIPRGYQGVSMRMAGAWEDGMEYVNDASYIDLVTYQGSTYGCKRTHTASEETVPIREGNEYWQCIAEKGETGDIENIDTVPIAFEEAEERENIESGDTIPKGLGKIRKWFSDFKQAAFYDVVNNVLQTEPGQKVLDAAVGKYLDDKKFDISRLVANRNITEPGFAMDGKTTADWLNELNGNMSKIKILKIVKTIGSRSWYRFAKKETSIHDPIVCGGSGEMGLFFISRTYEHNDNESYLISFNSSYGGRVTWRCLNSSINRQVLTGLKISLTQGESINIEIYYNSDAMNTLSIFVILNDAEGLSNWTETDLIPIPEDVKDVSIYNLPTVNDP